MLSSGCHCFFTSRHCSRGEPHRFSMSVFRGLPPFRQYLLHRMESGTIKSCFYIFGLANHHRYLILQEVMKVDKGGDGVPAPRGASTVCLKSSKTLLYLNTMLPKVEMKRILPRRTVLPRVRNHRLCGIRTVDS